MAIAALGLPAHTSTPETPLLIEPHAELIRASAISPEVAQARGYFSACTPEDLEALGFASSQRHAPALVLPIYDVKGELAFYQARPDSPRAREGKPIKYETPAGKRLVLDVPPAVRPVLGDPSEALWITEGTRKADAAVSIGVHCIAVIGTWGWRHREAKDGPSVPLPDWEHIALEGRRIYVAFDSDVMVKPSVRKALEALHAFLTAHGATVRLIYLPAGPDDEKVGLDDYIAAGHGERDLLELARPELAPAPASNGGGPTKAEQLVAWACDGGAELFHTPERKPWATVTVGEHRETMSLESSDFRDYLGRAAHESGVIGEQAIKDATARLRSLAIYDGQEHEVHTRLATRDDALYLDLGDARRRVIEIRSSGWQLLDGEAPVKFRRASGMRALPEPIAGGSVDELRPFVNVSEDTTWRLLIGWLVGCFAPSGPYPLLVLHGEQGSAKSTTARLLRSLIDPAKPELRSVPADERELLIAATNNRIVAFDNLSNMTGKDAWLSDALCRLSTGAGLAVRALYKNDEEHLFEVASPVILTGIEALPQRADLLERSLLVDLPPLADDQRETEDVLWRSFEEKRPRILGALLEAAAAALANRRRVQGELRSWPRMADHAQFVTAAESGLGWEPGAYMDSYTASRADTTAAALESSPLWPHLAELADGEQRTGSDLLDALVELAGETATKRRGWPKDARSLSAQIKRLAPDLRRVGIEAHRGTIGSKDRRRNTITLLRFPDSCDPCDPRDPLGSTEPNRGVAGGRFDFEGGAND